LPAEHIVGARAQAREVNRAAEGRNQMKLISGMILAASLILICATQGAAQDPAASSTQPTDWDYIGLNSLAIQKTAQNRGMRIVSAKWNTALNYDLFDAVLIKNEGDYFIKNWWWYPNVDIDELNAKINYHHARILHLAVRVNDSGKHYFSAVLVDNTGPNAKDWSWYFNVTPTYLASLAKKNNARLVEIATYWDNQKQEYMRAGVMIANTGADKKEWLYIFNMAAFAIPPLLDVEHMRLVNLQSAATYQEVLYDFVAEKDRGKRPTIISIRTQIK